VSAVTEEANFEGKPLVRPYPVQREVRLPLTRSWHLNEQRTRHGEAAQRNRASVDTMVNGTDSSRTVLHGEPDDVAAGRHADVCGDRRGVPFRDGEALVSGYYLPPFKVSHDDLQRRVTWLNSRRLAGEEEPEVRGVRRIRCEVARESEAHGSRRRG
jgi:hypothetical protein